MRITKKSTTFLLFLALGAGTSSAQEPPRGAVCNREAAVTFRKRSTNRSGLIRNRDGNLLCIQAQIRLRSLKK